MTIENMFSARLDREQKRMDDREQRRSACEKHDGIEYCRYYNGKYCNHICKYAKGMDVKT